MARVDKSRHMGNYGGKDFCLGFLGREDLLSSECSRRALCSVFDFRRIETIPLPFGMCHLSPCVGYELLELGLGPNQRL